MSYYKLKGSKKLKRRKDWLSLKEKMINKLNGICPCCFKEMKPGKREDLATVEHIIPLKWGGKDIKSNLTITCRGCNEKYILQKQLILIFVCLVKKHCS